MKHGKIIAHTMGAMGLLAAMGAVGNVGTASEYQARSAAPAAQSGAEVANTKQQQVKERQAPTRSSPPVRIYRERGYLRSQPHSSGTRQNRRRRKERRTGRRVAR
jgi:hypothetical protein